MPTRGGTVVNKRNKKILLLFLVQNDKIQKKKKIQKFLVWYQLWTPPQGPKMRIWPKKNLLPGEFLIDAINAKIIIRTPQMGQNVRPKVHQKNS